MSSAPTRAWLRIASRELAGGLAGFWIYLFCLALGAWAIAAAGSVTASFESGLQGQARRLLGGDAAFQLSQRLATPEERAWLEARGTVSEAAALDLMGRAGPVVRQVDVRGVDARFPLVGAVTLAGGPTTLAEAFAKRDGVWGVAATEKLLKDFNLKIGERFALGEHQVEVRAQLIGEPDRIGPPGGIEAHVLVALDALKEWEVLGTGRLFRSAYRLSLNPGVAPTLEVEATKAPWGSLLEEHVAAWQARWAKADIEIDGAPTIERALRFGLYHLMASVHPDDPRCSLGARALSGEAYRGHVFWDTEIFMLPLFVYTWPEAAKTLLLYRHRTLDGARRKAKKLGFEGALYAWESADTGDETTPEVVLTPFGELLPVLSGLEEHHISADVAYAVIEYARVTGDERFLREEGAEILIETARFWASRGSFGGDGKYHITRVIGPDEYHESVNDNAYTNWLARFNLRKAAEIAASMGQESARKLGVKDEEIKRWEQIAQRMYLGDGVRPGLIEQHAGFFSLEDIDVAAYEPRTVPLDVLLGRERTRLTQVVKQSDVVQLVALLWDEIDPAMRRDNFLYYEPRTGHGSSLSPGIHALVAARLGLVEMASRYLRQTAEIDLGNNMGNAAGGVHAAGMGSFWQAVVFGVAGLSQAADDPRILTIEPSLLPGMRRVSVPLMVCGQSFFVHACSDAIEVEVKEGDAPFGLRTRGSSGEVRSKVVEPGRSYVAKREGGGFSSWEEERR